MISETEKRNTKMECATYFNGNLWFISSEMPFLYRMNTLDGTTEKIVQISGFKNRSAFLYISMTYADEKLYMFPWSDTRIAIYDITESSLEYVEIDKEYSGYNFSGAIVTDDYIFSLCANYPAVLRIRRDNREVDYCEININNKTGFGYYFGGTAIVSQGKLYFTARNNNCLVEMNIKSLAYKIHELATDNVTFFGIDQIDDRFVCTPERGGNPIVYLDENFRIVEEKDSIGDSCFPINIFVDKEKEIYISLDDNLEIHGGEILHLHHGIQRFDGGFLAVTNDGKSIFVYRTGYTSHCFELKIGVDEDDLRKWIDDKFFYEGFLGVEDYINAIK